MRPRINSATAAIHLAARTPDHTARAINSAGVSGNGATLAIDCAAGMVNSAAGTIDRVARHLHSNSLHGTRVRSLLNHAPESVSRVTSAIDNASELIDRAIQMTNRPVPTIDRPSTPTSSATATINGATGSIDRATSHDDLSTDHGEKKSALVNIAARSGTRDAFTPSVRRRSGGGSDHFITSPVPVPDNRPAAGDG